MLLNHVYAANVTTDEPNNIAKIQRLLFSNFHQPPSPRPPISNQSPAKCSLAFPALLSQPHPQSDALGTVNL